jgi:LPPG:FO 2-phospho-L-lactate transferase
VRAANASGVGGARARSARLKVCILSGGVGGARFVRGVVDVVDPRDVTVIGNVGDDLDVLGLHVSPDLDSILYALAGLNDEERGWGRAGESWNALETVRELGGQAWFALGDRDLGLHLVRTEALRGGASLSDVTARLCAALGVETRLLPATDDELRTWLDTPAGSFEFQHWFVARGHQDDVDAVRYVGADSASAAPGVVDALRAAGLIVIAPSNPYVSIGPIVAVEDLRRALEERTVPCVAVSPLVGGRAVRGPADRMLTRLAGGTSPRHVAACYEGLVDTLVVDESDAEDLDGLAVRAVVTRTLMSDDAARRALAEVVLGVVPA